MLWTIAKLRETNPIRYVCEQSYHSSRPSSRYLPDMNRQGPMDDYKLSSVNSAEAMVTGCTGSKKNIFDTLRVLLGPSGPLVPFHLDHTQPFPCADVANKNEEESWCSQA